jgi:hypothetical protein
VLDVGEASIISCVDRAVTEVVVVGDGSRVCCDRDIVASLGGGLHRACIAGGRHDGCRVELDLVIRVSPASMPPRIGESAYCSASLNKIEEIVR